jgi:branched-chain amino acid transport system permease protein
VSQFLALTVAGIATYGCVYALAAMGLVVTYQTSGIFNFAQGAIGMMGAFLFWQLSQGWGWNALVSALVVVLVITPLVAAGLEQLVMRRLENAPLEAQLTVTIALIPSLLAISAILWNPAVARPVPEFFQGKEVSVGGVELTWHQLTIVAASVLVAGLLRLFFVRTRAGIATRAVVDDRELAGLTGAAPSRFAQLGWAMGCSLAAIAGILFAPLIELDATTLTLLVLSAYAAAMVGRLKSLPLTFLGAILLGLMQSYAIGYLPVSGLLNDLEPAIPMLFLVAVILVLPQTRASLERRSTVRSPRLVGRRESLTVAAAFVIGAVVVAQLLGATALSYANEGVALGIIMLSLVLLTGYGGQVSLCQLTFAGIGAFAMGGVSARYGTSWGLVAAAGLAGAVGAIVSLPSLRLRGLYLALITLAFAEGMDATFFTNLQVFHWVFSPLVPRPTLFGLSLSSDRAYLILECVVFALMAVGLLALRRSTLGRRLLAISDSPSACLTLGISMNRSKLVVFTVSAAMAGLGGALYGGAQGLVTPSNFAFLLSLTLLLIAVIFGIRTTTGAFVGGIVLALGPYLDKEVAKPRDVFELLVGLAAIGIAQNPEGLFGGHTPLQLWRSRRPGAAVAVVPALRPQTSSDGLRRVLSE